MTIQIDTREKPKAIQTIVDTFESQKIGYFRSKMYVGDYCTLDNPKYVIDRKQNLLEVAQNVVQDRQRFINEIKRAADVGIHVTVLVEHGYGIERLEDVMNWQNPRLKESPMAVSGERLYRIMLNMSKTYNFEWAFCNKKQTGNKIIEVLEDKEWQTRPHS